jgi:dihydroorotate dehydrogenase (NAD+) catalytic subunit
MGGNVVKPDLSTDLGPLKLRNPVLTASGTFGYGLEFADLMDLSRLGGIVIKSVTLEPRMGHSPPRVVETPAGLLNAIGLQNDGVEVFVREKMPKLRELGIPIIASVAGETLAEFTEVAQKLSRCEGIVALELNISCPNQEKGGIEFGVDPLATESVVKAVRNTVQLPLITKLSPNVTDITETAHAAVNAGSDILSLINSVWGMAIDPQTRRFKLAHRTGGLTGPAIKPIALYHVRRVATALPGIPVIGIGGISNWQDALEFLLAGASAIQIGTANFVQSTSAIEVLRGLELYLKETGLDRVAELVGSVEG